MEPSRREFKIPLRVLCLLSDKSESRGPPGLRAKLTSNSYLRQCTNENQRERMQTPSSTLPGNSLSQASPASSLKEGAKPPARRKESFFASL